MQKRDSKKPRRSTAEAVRSRVTRGGARLWKHADFDDLPPGAVAQTLSRLSREGSLQRVAKGVYYHPEATSFGPSVPSASAVTAGTILAPVYPAGLTGANALGLSTQNPYRTEFATVGAGVPAALRGFIVHPGRPRARASLSTEEGAILEVLRERAQSSDLSPEETAVRLLELLDDRARFTRMARVALAEPPRVRAMLGAIGEELEMPAKALKELKDSLNPLSRYDFGRLSSLRYAKRWQAK